MLVAQAAIQMTEFVAGRDRLAIALTVPSATTGGNDQAPADRPTATRGPGHSPLLSASETMPLGLRR